MDASAAHEPTRATAGVTDAASEAAQRRSAALEASDTSGESSVERSAHARREGNDYSARPTDSAGNQDREPSAGRAVHQGTSTVRPAARRATQTVLKQAEPVVEKARENVEETVDRAETTLAATKPVIDKARGIVGRDRGEASEPAPGAVHPATTAPAVSESEPRIGGAPREPLPAQEAPGPVRLVTEPFERLVPMPAPAAGAPPGLRRLASAALQPSEYAAPRQASATLAPVRLDPSDSASIAPLGDPADRTSSAPGGGLSSMSLMFGGTAATIAAFCLAAPSLLRRLRLSPALVRPVAFVSLLERPG